MGPSIGTPRDCNKSIIAIPSSTASLSALNSDEYVLDSTCFCLLLFTFFVLLLKTQETLYSL